MSENITMKEILENAQRMLNDTQDDIKFADTLLTKVKEINLKEERRRNNQIDLDSFKDLPPDNPRKDTIENLLKQKANLLEIRKENRELKLQMEHYECFKELIIIKYNEQYNKLSNIGKIDLKKMYDENLMEIIREQGKKIDEMIAVMQYVANLDDDNDDEVIAHLRLENEELRELLMISIDNVDLTNCCIMDEKGTQTEATSSKLMDQQMPSKSMDLITATTDLLQQFKKCRELLNASTNYIIENQPKDFIGDAPQSCASTRITQINDELKESTFNFAAGENIAGGGYSNQSITNINSVMSQFVVQGTDSDKPSTSKFRSLITGANISGGDYNEPVTEIVAAPPLPFICNEKNIIDEEPESKAQFLSMPGTDISTVVEKLCIDDNNESDNDIAEISSLPFVCNEDDTTDTEDKAILIVLPSKNTDDVAPVKSDT